MSSKQLALINLLACSAAQPSRGKTPAITIILKRNICSAYATQAHDGTLKTNERVKSEMCVSFSP